MNNQNELYRKILITFILLIFARLGIFIPIPGIDHDSFYSNVQQNTFINFLNIFSGGGFSTIGIFALGIVPYINSSIFIQLLTKMMPRLEKVQKEEGESGRQKITQITRYLTLTWAILQSIAISLWVRPYVFNWNLQFILDCSLTLSTGSLIIMWFSELITEYGIGNGPSLLIFQNIISSIPKNIKSYILQNSNSVTISEILTLTSLLILMLFITILIQEGTRKVSIISARQLTNNNEIGSKSYIPLKLNPGGVMPIVFASAAITFTSYLQEILRNNTLFPPIILKIMFSSPLYFTLYGILIIVFSYFYSSLILNPKDIAKNLKKMSASIPSIRPGNNTIKHLKEILDRLTLLGSMFLFLIALFPSIITTIVPITAFKGLGATSLLILVGVAIDTTKQIQTYIISKQYNSMIK